MLLQLHHLYHVEEVEADGQGQAGEEHGAEQQAVLVGGVAGEDFVQVEDAYAEHREVRTDTQVGHHANGENLHTDIHKTERQSPCEISPLLYSIQFLDQSGPYLL